MLILLGAKVPKDNAGIEFFLTLLDIAPVGFYLVPSSPAMVAKWSHAQNQGIDALVWVLVECVAERGSRPRFAPRDDTALHSGEQLLGDDFIGYAGHTTIGASPLFSIDLGRGWPGL